MISVVLSLLPVNVRGSFIMTNYSLEEMQKRDYGRILLIASIAGKEARRKSHLLLQITFVEFGTMMR